jgi:hypothetical protein
MVNEPKNKGRERGINVLFAMAPLLLIMIFTGCQSMNPLPKFGVGNATPEEARIKKLMKWHSGRVEVYREFRTVFSARAVYLSDEIQSLASDWEARSKLMSPEERAVFEKKIMGDDAQLIKVLVGFYTPEETQNDLSKANSIWIPYLKNPDGTVTRAICLDVDEDSSRIYMRFLKWDLSWSKLYLLCFPYSPDLHNPEDGWLSMVISGPQGQGEIRLRVVPPDDQP